MFGYGINVGVIGSTVMDIKTKIIFKIKCLILKCREKGKFLKAIKLRNKLINYVSRKNNR